MYAYVCAEDFSEFHSDWSSVVNRLFVSSVLLDTDKSLHVFLVDCLQAAEAHLVHLFEDANLCAIHAKR
jgi:peptide methionine sulfoxide reductase MsrB